ncbi:MAG: PLP-dependent aspartate aminotransferase family protein [Gaiellaceae bacterium]|jgi:cystathionine beta-lyase/cystathionine gamma-synthase
MSEKRARRRERLSLETLLAGLTQPPLDRSTVWPYCEGEIGPFAYQRYDHPLAAELENVLGELESGRALLFSCGMAAIAGIALSFCKPGDIVAVPIGAYVSTSHLISDELSRFGLELAEFDQTGLPPENAALVWLEPCSNPLLSFPDLDESIVAAHRRGARVAVDVTTLTPVLLRPLEHGADFSVYSATKLLGGHHDLVLGVAACAHADDAERLYQVRRLFGLIGSPDPAWLLLRSLKTLPLRVERSSATALELASRLQEHPAVERVNYPGLSDPVAARYLSAFGPLLSFVVRGGAAAAEQLERSCELIANATSFGGARSTIEARSRWEGDRVPAGLLRLSAGLEDAGDLWRDLEQALAPL